MESVINDLYDYGLKIYQMEDKFKFSLDSILLAEFVELKQNTKHIVDFCTGNAPVPLILSTKTKAHIYGFEIQSKISKLASLSVRENSLDSQISIVNANFSDVLEYVLPESIDAVTCNPPYFKFLETSNLNDDIHKVIARHEKMITLEEIISLSKYLLKNNGVLAMVHRTDRLIEIINLFQKYGMEVKKIRFIYPKINTESNMVLIEGRKNGKTGLKLLPPLYAHNEDGSYTEEVLRMFE